MGILFTHRDTGLYPDYTVNAQHAGTMVNGVIDNELRLLEQRPAKEPRFPPGHFETGQCPTLGLAQHSLEIIGKRGIAFAFFLCHNTAPGRAARMVSQPTATHIST
jgi:hypothetical protein